MTPTRCGGLRAVLAGALLLSLATPAAVRAQERAPAPAPECLDAASIPDTTRLAIEGAALRVLRFMARRQSKPLWAAAHPLFRDTWPRERLSAWLEDIEDQLGQLRGARIARLWLVPGREGPPATEVVSCPEGGRVPGETRVRLGRDPESVAIVLVEMPGALVGRVVTIQLREVYGDWRVARVDFGIHSYQGQGPVSFAARGEKLLESGEVLRAVVNLEAAALLALPAPYVLTPLMRGVLSRRQEVSRSGAYTRALGSWPAGARRVRMHAITVTPHEDRLALAVLYVSPEWDDPEVLAAEARALRAYLDRNHPEFGFQFDTVVFHAYAEAPTDPERQYASESVTLPLIE